jgi:hypothetical protein
LWVLQLMRDVIETEFVRQYMQSDDVGLPPAGERTAEGMLAWVESHRCDATFSFVWDLLTAMKVRRPCPLLPRPLCHTRRRACPVVCCEAPRWAWLSVACAALQDLELFHEGMRTNNLDAIETARTGLLPWAFATGRHEYGPIGVLQQAMYGPGGCAPAEVRKVFADFIAGCASGNPDECQAVDANHEEAQKRATATGTTLQHGREGATAACPVAPLGPAGAASFAEWRSVGLVRAPRSGEHGTLRNGHLDAAGQRVCGARRDVAGGGL